MNLTDEELEDIILLDLTPTSEEHKHLNTKDPRGSMGS